jgi:predicted RNA-binding Zn-ribbon protein involved in translation (DUF1610 family)
MPPINHYKCNKCGFALPSGWGGYMYVEDDKKKRIVCPHPVEDWTVAEVLGDNAPIDLIKARTGFNSYCLCLDCLHQFEADLGDERANPWRGWYGAMRQKDERKCPQCKSTNIATVFELIGTPCPKCKDGLIEEIETGIIS